MTHRPALERRLPRQALAGLTTVGSGTRRSEVLGPGVHCVLKPIHLTGLMLVALGGAPAQAAPQFEAAFRAGVAFPFGDALGGEAMQETTPPMVPLQLEAGLRFSPTVFLGLFGGVGIAISSAPHEPQCYRCVGHVLMLGVEALFHLAPASAVDPWLGVGVGLEMPGDIDKVVGGNSTDPVFRQSSGPMVELQIGLDIPIGQHLAAGPWTGLVVGAYTERTEQSGTSHPSTTAMHFWVSAGARIAVRL